MPLRLLLCMSAAVMLSTMPAQARRPSLSLIEQAQSCDGNSTCPYFPEVYQADYAFRSAFNVALKKAGLKRQRWVPNGVTTPFKPVEIDGKARLLSSVCEPHNCGHHYTILYDPADRRMTGVYVGSDGKGGARTVYFGDPSIAEADMLSKN
ncbi:Ivy family c-type lysozyme inhibitor [Janthinobacterium sp. HLX7-2]|uniref:Ivy family c-type lysozyme inhibitor n=1 Tax=Janthinobacterium sp. HLX7-2 TaxID=1259331 RepID=UPI003F25D671